MGALPRSDLPGCGEAPELDRHSGDAEGRHPSCRDTVQPLGRGQRRSGIGYGPSGTDRHHLPAPVLWLTPIYLDEQGTEQALWRLIDPDRLAQAQREMLCQFCGMPVPMDASVTVIIDDTGWVMTTAPLHVGCATVAMNHCPAIRREGTAVDVDGLADHWFGFIDPDVNEFEDSICVGTSPEPDPHMEIQMTTAKRIREGIVWIGPPQPVPPGDCHCMAIDDEITRWNLDCPCHGEQPVIPPRHMHILEPHSADDPATVWQTVSAQAEWALGQWHTKDVRPTFVGDHIVWICATLVPGSRGERSAEYGLALRSGGWTRMQYRTRRATPRLLAQLAKSRT